VPLEDVEFVADEVQTFVGEMLQASPYFATRRSVFCSPVPPIRIRGCGRERDWGEFNVSASW
jgi:hypothetical protein